VEGIETTKSCQPDVLHAGENDLGRERVCWQEKERKLLTKKISEKSKSSVTRGGGRRDFGEDKNASIWGGSEGNEDWGGREAELKLRFDVER